MCVGGFPRAAPVLARGADLREKYVLDAEWKVDKKQKPVLTNGEIMDTNEENCRGIGFKRWRESRHSNTME